MSNAIPSMATSEPRASRGLERAAAGWRVLRDADRVAVGGAFTSIDGTSQSGIAVDRGTP